MFPREEVQPLCKMGCPGELAAVTNSTQIWVASCSVYFLLTAKSGSAQRVLSYLISGVPRLLHTVLGLSLPLSPPLRGGTREGATDAMQSGLGSDVCQEEKGLKR